MNVVAAVVKMSFSDAGTGLPLVFLHGFPFSRRIWEKQSDFFWTSWRVIAPDLRGFGATPTHLGPATMGNHVDDLHALLVELGTGPVVLVGHSMGGYVALEFARVFPGLLRGLVLVSTKAGADSGEAAASRVAMARLVKERGMQVVVEAMAVKMLAPGNQNAEMAREVHRSMAAARSTGVIGALVGMAKRPDATALLPEIAVPTLVVTGAEDALIPPAESELLAQAIPGAQLSVIPNAGHLVAFEQPEEFNRILSEWLTSRNLAAPAGTQEKKANP